VEVVVADRMSNDGASLICLRIRLQAGRWSLVLGVEKNEKAAGG
jgi:hypothetical protein